MKKIFLTALLLNVFAFVACTTDADDEFNAAKICPAEGTNAYGMPNRGTFIDERDGQEYEYTTIGDQVWMAENLNYESERSIVYECQESNCEGFGRYYSIWDDKSDEGPIDRMFMETLCPAGWHVPTKDEWLKLFDKFGGEEDYSVGSKLRNSDSSYYNLEWRKPGEDACAFNALPAGETRNNDEFDGVNMAAIFWTSTASSVNGVYIAAVDRSVLIGISILSTSGKENIRCLKD